MGYKYYQTTKEQNILMSTWIISYASQALIAG